jgi:hypothetical protein
MAIRFVASRPSVTSPSGSGIVESFSGPAIARSLGYKEVPPSLVQLSYHSFQRIASLQSLCPLSEQFRSLSDWIGIGVARNPKRDRLPDWDMEAK